LHAEAQKFGFVGALTARYQFRRREGLFPGCSFSTTGRHSSASIAIRSSQAQAFNKLGVRNQNTPAKALTSTGVSRCK
jgi:hypothetical protein